MKTPSGICICLSVISALAISVEGSSGSGDWNSVEPSTQTVGQVRNSSSSAPHEVISLELTKYGFIDKTGKLVIEPRFDSGSNFLGGLAQAKSGDKWGYIDTTGTFIIPPTYDDVSSFEEGLACVKANGKWGYTDRADHTVIQPQYDVAGGFSDGLACIRINDKYGYIGKTGEVVIQPQYLSAFGFRKGRAFAQSAEGR